MNQSIICLLKEEKKQELKKNSKTFIDYSQTINDVYENLKHYDPTKKRKVLIVFDDMTASKQSNKKFSALATELFFRGKNLTFCLFLYHNIFSKCLKL